MPFQTESLCPKVNVIVQMESEHTYFEVQLFNHYAMWTPCNSSLNVTTISSKFFQNSSKYKSLDIGNLMWFNS